MESLYHEIDWNAIKHSTYIKSSVFNWLQILSRMSKKEQPTTLIYEYPHENNN